jgi:hypothetical protein
MDVDSKLEIRRDKLWLIVDIPEEPSYDNIIDNEAMPRWTLNRYNRKWLLGNFACFYLGDYIRIHV